MDSLLAWKGDGKKCAQLIVDILTYNDRDVTHLHMIMILSGAWPQATAWPRRAWPQATAWQGPGAACGRRASAGASRPAWPGYGLREIQGRESSGEAASQQYSQDLWCPGCVGGVN